MDRLGKKELQQHKSTTEQQYAIKNRANERGQATMD